MISLKYVVKEIWQILKLLEYISLDDQDKYDIPYLYHLLTKTDHETRIKYIEHIPIRWKFILAVSYVQLLIVMCGIGIYYLCCNGDTKTILTIIFFSITFSITVSRIVDSIHQRNIHYQIEYRKYLEQKNEKNSK